MRNLCLFRLINSLPYGVGRIKRSFILAFLHAYLQKGIHNKKGWKMTGRNKYSLFPLISRYTIYVVFFWLISIGLSLFHLYHVYSFIFLLISLAIFVHSYVWEQESRTALWEFERYQDIPWWGGWVVEVSSLLTSRSSNRSAGSNPALTELWHCSSAG